MTETFLTWLNDLLPLFVVLLVGAMTIGLLQIYWARRKKAGQVSATWTRQLLQACIGLVWAVSVLLSLPLEPQTRGQLFTLLGLIVSATIALSSTTFMGNMMAGMMLRVMRNFSVGDFLKVDKHFGRVSEVDLFHVEIQTEDHTLVTLPNLSLVSSAVEVTHGKGALVEANLSLGYDVPRDRVSELLKQAAAAAGLEDGFVHVTSLNDFSVSYRIAGFLAGDSGLITTRSRLKEQVLDHLHKGGVEIVSPTFMNQRVYPVITQFIPASSPRPERKKGGEDAAEKRLFGKAEKAAALEHLKGRKAEMEERIKGFKEELKNIAEGDDPRKLEKKITRLEFAVQQIQAAAEAMAEDLEDDGS